MKKYLIFILLFCSAVCFANVSCDINSEKIDKIVLKHSVTKGLEQQTGFIYLKDKTKITIDDFTSWCNIAVGEIHEIKSLATQLPDNCSLCLYQKITDNALVCGCKCSVQAGAFICY